MEERLVSYIYCFNELEDYFLCHEYGESLWLDSGRPVMLKGLIQAAVCLYHLHGGNARGGWRMWSRARTYLSDTKNYQGIDIEQLITDIDEVWQHVPEQWRHETVSIAQVKSLQLPSVKIRYLDPQLETVVQSWTLPPLETD
ncbi:DUF309 domain-containing protein [Alicyclobacillus mengziensis]|uniref:DUF309 domain-containing protein n=1 Tax=Alicyclobacillus mengziensis TaxID=2931921 RepID=A0A9X7Z6F4_9BACL|nr:DUF309 domain-containing protein [Alicyclobacillus mengziensis]QSO46190.1 DUF309 domain-containing protein [Alicyclobacillus mengziensis]